MGTAREALPDQRATARTAKLAPSRWARCRMTLLILAPAKEAPAVVAATSPTNKGGSSFRVSGFTSGVIGAGLSNFNNQMEA